MIAETTAMVRSKHSCGELHRAVAHEMPSTMRLNRLSVPKLTSGGRGFRAQLAEAFREARDEQDLSRPTTEGTANTRLCERGAAAFNQARLAKGWSFRRPQRKIEM